MKKDGKTYTAEEIEAEIASFSRKIGTRLKECGNGDLGVIVASLRVDSKTKQVTSKGGSGGNREAIAAMVAAMIMGNPDISAKTLAIINSAVRRKTPPQGGGNVRAEPTHGD